MGGFIFTANLAQSLLFLNQTSKNEKAPFPIPSFHFPL